MTNMPKSKADIVMEKHAGLLSKGLGYAWKGIRKGWRALTGTTTKPTVIRRTGQIAKDKIKKHALPTAIATGTVGAGVYTNEKRKQARKELADFRADNQFWTAENNNTYDTITGSSAFQDSLRTDSQKAGLLNIKDPNKRKVQQSAIDNYNVVRYGKAENPVNEADRDYRANLINQGKLNPWLEDASIVSQQDKERAAELKANQGKKKK